MWGRYIYGTLSEIWFQNWKSSHFVHRVTSNVHIDHGTGHMLGQGSALQHGPVSFSGVHVAYKCKEG